MSAMPRIGQRQTKTLLRLTGPVCPAINDDRMGTMGSTQGVKASSKPASQNTPTVRNKLPEASVDAIESVAGGACLTGASATFA